MSLGVEREDADTSRPIVDDETLGCVVVELAGELELWLARSGAEDAFA